MLIPSSLQSLSEIASSSLESSFTIHMNNQAFVEPRLHSAMKYALLNGGKRMRPLLVYLTGDMFKLAQHDLSPLALAIECIHAYSLVHDDLPAMDDDHLRRGQPTCHIEFDEATAILAGDALQTLAFEILADASFDDAQKNVKLISALCKASGPAGMVGGQSLDLLSTNKGISLEDLRLLHTLKTGAMIKASITLPCLLVSDIANNDMQKLIEFADCIGLAFQIQDDILDVTTDTEVLGKPQGSDANANKSTFVSLLGLEGAKKELEKHHQQAIHALASLPYNTDKLKDFADFMLTRTY